MEELIKNVIPWLGGVIVLGFVFVKIILALIDKNSKTIETMQRAAVEAHKEKSMAHEQNTERLTANFLGEIKHMREDSNAQQEKNNEQQEKNRLTMELLSANLNKNNGLLDNNTRVMETMLKVLNK